MNPDAITFRTLEPDDEPILWIMLYLAIHVAPGEAHPPLNVVFEPELARYARGWGRAGDCGCAAFNARGLPIGAAWLRLFPREAPGYGWVDAQTPEISIALLPEYRGQGIGTQLMEKALALAEERCVAVSLSVVTTNPAVHLYRRLGFEEVKQKDGSLTMVRKRARD